MFTFGKHSAKVGADDFARLVIEKLHALGVKQKITYDPEEFEINFESGMTARLGRAFREYSAAGSSGDNVIQYFARAYREAQQGLPHRFSDAAPFLMMAVRSRAACHATLISAMKDVDALTNVPKERYLLVAPHLGAELVFSTERTIMGIGSRQLAEWNGTWEQAHDVAMQNLRRLTTQGFALVAPGLYAGSWKDDFAPSRLLCPELYQNLDIKGAPVAFATSRNTLLVTGSDDDGNILKAAKKAEVSFLNDEHPVSAIPVRLTPKGWVPFDVPVGHPAHAILHKLQLATLQNDYDTQAKAMDWISYRRDGNVFIAHFFASDVPGLGLRSFCIWNNAINSLLPKTDYVAFVTQDVNAKTTSVDGYDVDLEIHEQAPSVLRKMREAFDAEGGKVLGHAPWDRVMAVVGHRMAPFDVQGYPERFLVRSFPTPEELAALNLQQPPYR